MKALLIGLVLALLSSPLSAQESPPDKELKSTLDYTSCGVWEGSNVVYTDNFGVQQRVPKFRAQCLEKAGTTVMRFWRVLWGNNLIHLETRVHHDIGFVVLHRNLFAYSYQLDDKWYIYGNYKGTSGPFLATHGYERSQKDKFEYVVYYKKPDGRWYKSGLFMDKNEFYLGQELAYINRGYE